MNTLWTRILSGIIYAFIVFLGTHFVGYDLLHHIFPESVDSRYFFLGFIVLMYLFCAIELVNIMKFEGIIYKIAAIVIGGLPLYYFGMQLLGIGSSFHFEFRKLLLVAPCIIAWVTIFRFSEELDNIDSSKIIFFVCYLGMPFGLALMLQDFASFPSEVFYIFLLIWISDSAAYLVGSKWGKTPLAPKISPNKSIEGLAGGLVLTLIAGILIELYVGYLNGNWVVISIIIAGFAPMGDLAESKIKRTFGVKDSGKIIAGHGGFLDRLDSFIGVTPMIYLYFLLANVFTS